MIDAFDAWTEFWNERQAINRLSDLRDDAIWLRRDANAGQEHVAPQRRKTRCVGTA